MTELPIRDCHALSQPAAPPRTIAGAADIVEGARLLVAPGLINGHTHSHENFTKGRYENLPLELWSRFVRPPDPIPLTARQVCLRTMIGAIEALRTGATTVVDDVNIYPVLEPAHLDAVLEAYEDVGIRAIVCPGLFDKALFDTLPYVRETFPGDTLAALAGVRATPPRDRLAHVSAKLDGRHARHPREARVAMAISPSAPQRCSAAFLMDPKWLADDRDLPVIIHVQETRLQVVSGQLFYGRTMIEHLDALGFLRPGVSLIHGVWLNPREIDILARSGATVQHNPVSNMAFGWGLAPVRALLQAGVNVSLGTDARGSSFTTSMIKTVNATALTQKLRGADHEKWITAHEAWAAGAMGGAKALGLDGTIGAIRPRMRADLNGWSLDGWAFRPLNDPLRQLVYAATGAELSLAVVDGEVALRDGRHVRIDEEAVWREIEDAHGEIAERMATSDAQMAKVVGSYAKFMSVAAPRPSPKTPFRRVSTCPAAAAAAPEEGAVIKIPSRAHHGRPCESAFRQGASHGEGVSRRMRVRACHRAGEDATDAAEGRHCTKGPVMAELANRPMAGSAFETR